MNKSLHITKEQREVLLAFYDIAKEIFDDRLEKMIYFSHQKASAHALEVFLLFSSLSKGDHTEIAQLADDLSEEILITPTAMDQKTYQAALSKGQQLARDIQETGIEFP